MRFSLSFDRSSAKQLVYGILLTAALLVAPVAVHADSDSDDPPTQRSTPSATQAPDLLKVDAEAARQMGIQVEPVTRKQLWVGLKTTGQIEALPNQKVAVTAPILGTVVRFLVQPNDAVEAGQIVALLSSPELAQLRVEAIQKRDEAEAGLQQAEADLKLARQNDVRQRQQATADLTEAQTQVALAQERYDRNRELQAEGAVTRRQVQESATELAAAHATLTKAQSKLGELESANQLSKAQSEVAVAQSRLRLSDSAYRARLQQLKTTANDEGLVTVTAPIAGTVADRPVTPGETVTVEAASKPLMTIVNAQRVWATANLYEKDLAQVAVGQSARVTVTSLPQRRFTGRVAQIGTVVEGSRVVPVKVELENAQQALKPGMFAALEILTQRTPVSVVAVPHTAVVDNGGTPRVFVQQGEGYRSVPVTLGQQSGDWVEVKTGLQAGDRVVIAGATLLYAQSLGGAGIPSDDDDKPEEGKKSNPDLDDLLREIKIPVWIGLPGALVMAGGAFWAGRRSRQQPAPLAKEKFTPDPSVTLEPPAQHNGIPSTETADSASEHGPVDSATHQSQQD